MRGREEPDRGPPRLAARLMRGCGLLAVAAGAAGAGWTGGLPGLAALALLGAAFVALEARRRRAAEGLARAKEEFERLACLLVHDLKAPLRRIRSRLDLVREGAGSRLEYDEARSLEHAAEIAGRLQELVDALLAYAGMRARRPDLRRVDLNELLRTVSREFAPLLTLSGGELRSAGLPVVRGDPALLGSLFTNLLDNALKYHGPRAPCIDVRARREGAEWIVSVADNGVGIEAARAERIFGLFERAARGHATPGAGIGLALCRKAAELHGGRIWAEPGAAGGAVFHVALPAD